MKIHKIIFVLAYICLFWPHTLFADQTSSTNSKNQWYNLDEGDEYVTDFLLKPSATQVVTVDSDKPIVVGFESNISVEKMIAYKNAKKNRSDDNVIKVVQPDAYQTSFSFDSGMHLMLLPIKGKINLAVSNNANEDCKIMISINRHRP